MREKRWSAAEGHDVIDIICSQLYKYYVVFIEVCRGTKQRQHHGDTGITIIFFTIVKNFDEQWNISLFLCKT